MTEGDVLWRVSAATMNRVLFARPRDGALMLALERRATLAAGPGEAAVDVLAQPFGGAVRIRDATALRRVIAPGEEPGGLRFDSERSRAEQDFRILIPPERWPAVRAFCLRHLAASDDPVLETGPQRELAEEFADTLGVSLSPRQYSVTPAGFVVENRPAQTGNVRARGVPTVRIYRVYEVRIMDEALAEALLASSARHDTAALRALARADAARGGKGRANAALALPLAEVIRAYRALPPERRYAPLEVTGYLLDPSTAAVLPGVEAPQYERLDG